MKLLAFTALVLPELEYTSVWNPHQSNVIYNLEAIQNRAVHFINSDYSYETSISTLEARAKLTDLFIRRKMSRLMLFYKFHYTTLPYPKN